MSIELKVPMLPESVADATVLTWHKKAGDHISRDEVLVELETDKVVLEVPAPDSGTLEKIIQQDGATVVANDILAVIELGAAAEKKAPSESKTDAATEKKTSDTSKAETPAKAPKQKEKNQKATDTSELSPSVRRLVTEHDIDVSMIKGTGKGGRIIKEDVMKVIKQQPSAAAAVKQSTGERFEKRVPMSRLRARIAERLVQAQHTAAMLTTFNEVNLQNVMDLRAEYKEEFEKQHGVRLGFMSFFTRASVEALKRFPAVNASLDGNDIVYHGYYDIGIAVSTERGLVVPILRDADTLSMADIEKQILDFALRARENKLTIEELQGGTFTITNGGIFGSLLSTPILNPPQVAILGMQTIQKRPVVEDDQIVIRPMMYLSMTYDHRIIDGKESVQFLVAIKELLEDPSRLLLEV